MIKIAAIYDVSFPFIKGGGQRRLFEVMSRLNNQDNYSFFWFTYKAWPQSKNVLDLENITYKSIGRLPNLYNADGKRSKTQPLNFVWNILRNIKSIGENDIVWVAQWPLLHLIPICIFKLVFKTLGLVSLYSISLNKVGSSYFILYNFFKLGLGCNLIVEKLSISCNSIS